MSDVIQKKNIRIDCKCDEFGIALPECKKLWAIIKPSVQLLATDKKCIR